MTNLTLTDEELTAFLTAAATTYATTSTAALEAPDLEATGAAPDVAASPQGGHIGIVYRALVIQGDVAFRYAAAPDPAGPGPLAPPVHLSGPLAVIAGESGRHGHWVIPDGPGVTWAPVDRMHLRGHLRIPPGVIVRVHHDADPIEHEDFLIGSGHWSVHRQVTYLHDPITDTVTSQYEAHRVADLRGPR